MGHVSGAVVSGLNFLLDSPTWSEHWTPAIDEDRVGAAAQAQTLGVSDPGPAVTSTILVTDARFLRTWKRRVGAAGVWPSFFDVPFL